MLLHKAGLARFSRVLGGEWRGGYGQAPTENNLVNAADDLKDCFPPTCANWSQISGHAGTGAHRSSTFFGWAPADTTADAILPRG
jgi:hypothetical protein